MKKFILYIVVFFSVVTAIDFVFGKTCDYMTTHAKGGETKQLVDLCKKDHYDMFVMGSSKAHHNYVPQVFADSLGLTCYNAGYDGNGIILAYAILSMIDDNRLPKLVVYDVKQQFDIYHYDGDGDYTRYYQKLKTFIYEPIVLEIVKSISKVDVAKLQSGLVRYNSDLFFTLSGFLKRERTDNDNGFNPMKGQLEDSNVQEKDYSYEVDTLKLSYFRKFIKMTKEKKLDLIVVFSPEFNTPYAEDFWPVRELCEEEGISVIDLFEEHSYQKKELFVDHCHMNESGARLFSIAMVREMKNRLSK